MLTATPILSRGIGLQYLPHPDELQIPWDMENVCIVCGNADKETYELLRELRERNWKIALISLSPSNKKNPFKIPQWNVDNFEEAEIHNLIKMITEKCGHIAGFIAISKNITDSSDVPLLEQQAEKRFVDFVFLMATQLKSLLQAAAAKTRAWFVTVNSIDGQFGLSGNPVMQGIISGGLSALTKTLHREWPQVFCRSVDFSPLLLATEWTRLLTKELFDADSSLVEVSYTQNKRYTLIAVEPIEC